jgi:hypothetical protein
VAIENQNIYIRNNIKRYMKGVVWVIIVVLVAIGIYYAFGDSDLSPKDKYDRNSDKIVKNVVKESEPKEQTFGEIFGKKPTRAKSLEAMFGGSG